MRANKARDTTPELAIRKILHAAGYRYRVDFAPDPSTRRRRADLVFTRVRLAVFVDGCFWHGCPIHGTIPIRNRDYWEPKLLKNIERDLATTESLRGIGWSVLRIWEHVAPTDAARTIIDEVTRLRAPDGIVHVDRSAHPTKELD
ncbi:very short patch repair endonuclease, partial [Pseudomonas sp. BGM005]|nr:very short patch repair endonuclease [Pseudomonas sp. BG5]